jgi:hypothetical protein
VLKPGGVMVCEEADVSAVYTEPSSPAYVEVLEICLEAGRQRGVDSSGGRRAHSWAKEAGFDVMHVDAYHPHYLTGEHKGFWNWTLRGCRGIGPRRHAGRGPSGGACRRNDRGGRLTDTVVAHCRMHQLIARKPTTTA